MNIGLISAVSLIVFCIGIGIIGIILIIRNDIPKNYCRGAKMNKQELLRFAVTQNQFIKGYDEHNPRECYNKVLNSYRQLYDKVVNYCVLGTPEQSESLQTQPVDNYEAPHKKTSQNEKEISKIAENTTTFSTYDKSHPFSSGWNTFRLESVIYLHKIGKSNEEIAKIINSTPVKVKKIISEYEFSQI